MAVDKLAQITQAEFRMMHGEFNAVGKKMADEFRSVRTEMACEFQAVREEMATKDDVRSTEAKILQAVDNIMVRFDDAEKDHAADKLLHDRHERRLEKLEVKVFGHA